MKPIRIFTMVWGPYYDMFYKYCMPSMFQSGNIPKLLFEGYDVKWCLYSHETPVKNIDCVEFHRTEANEKPDINDGFREFIKDNQDAICAIVMPDFFIGNNSLYNGIKIVEDKKGQCLSVANARVSIEKINGIDIPAKNNQELVDFAFKYGHKCLIETCDIKDPNMTWCGLSWRQIDNNNFAVVHNIATPWILQFSESDLEVFMGPNLGQIDRGFLEKLINEKRIKICGSSDLCFFIEFTSNKHNPPVREGLKNNDRPQYEETGRDYYNNVVINWRR